MKRTVTLVVGVTGLVLAAASSHASFTTVNDLWGVNGAGGEWNLYNTHVGANKGDGIMEYLYGSFTRVDDASDIQWVGLNGGVRFDAVYAVADQSLYTAGVAGSPISSRILDEDNATPGAPARGVNVTPFTPVAQPFLFLDKTGLLELGNWAYSDPARSSGGVDRMVTFAVTGYLATPGNINTWTPFTTGGTTHYVLGFEDGTDRDFQDLVVEVSGVTPVPEPTTMIAGALLLLPFGASTVRILRKRNESVIA